MAKKTIASLEKELKQLTQERDHNLVVAQESLGIANNFMNRLGAIETVVNASPFANTKFKFFPTLWWVLTNFKALKTFVEAVIQHIKEWRSQVDELVEKAKTNTPAN
jgi:hypothetical protein